VALDLAKEFGELAFYGYGIFLLISLARKLPYQRFRLIHKLGAVLALLALFAQPLSAGSRVARTPFGLLTRPSVCLIRRGLWSLTAKSVAANATRPKLVATVLFAMTKGSSRSICNCRSPLVGIPPGQFVC
jgi:predicted ferric reductase